MAVKTPVDKYNKMKKNFLVMLLAAFSFLITNASAQSHKSHPDKTTIQRKPGKKTRTRYGVASFYAKKFNGTKMANGEIYRPEKYTAACNILPLNTWIKVTNLKNDKSIIVKIKDRMNRNNKRLVDLSQSAAKKLGYLLSGLTRVKVEVLNNYTPGKIE
jgi:rare lipoprotein A